MVDLQALARAEATIKNNFFRAEGAIQRLKSFVIMNSALPRSGNAILWGPGGYGKTEMGYQFIKEATGQEPYVVNLNQATTAAEMWGGVNLPSLINDSEVKYNIDNSFMQHEWVIFEEGLEPRPRVLSALKHLITSGVFAAAGVTSTQIKTKGILIVTNVDTAGFMDSLDTAAFLERFPIQFCVNWNHLNNHERFQASLQVVQKFDSKNAIPANMRQTLAEHFAGRKQSPRMISRAVQALTATAEASRKSTVDVNIFNEVATLFNFGTEDMTNKVEEDRIDHNVKEARKAYEVMFQDIELSIKHYNSLRDSLHDARYIIKLATKLKATMELIESLSDSVVDMRVNAKFGKRGDELASWVNGKLGEYKDSLDDIKHASYDGMLAALIKVIGEE